MKDKRVAPWEKVAVFTFGVVFVVALLVLAIAFPHPTSFQYEVFKVVLAMAAAGIASVVPGFLQVEIPGLLRAGGALAVFALVYFFSPASLVVETTLEPDPKALEMGMGAELARLALVARGPESVSWNVESLPEGFSVVPDSGIVPTNSSSTIEVHYQRGAGPIGIRSGELRFAYSGESGPKTKQVGLRVSAVEVEPVQFRFGAVDDRAFLLISGQQVAETTGGSNWKPIPSTLFHEGANDLELRVYNAASRTGWPDQKREGWNFHFLLRIGDEQKEFSDGVKEPPTEQWGSTFTVLKKVLLVSSEGRVVLQTGA